MVGDDDPGPEYLDNHLLATVMMWFGKTTIVHTEQLIAEYYKYEDVYSAHVLLSEKMKTKKPVKHKNATKMQESAKELVVAIKAVSSQSDPKIKLVVSPENMALVPLVEGTWGTKDEVSTSARLLNLEKLVNDLRVDLVKGLSDVKHVKPAYSEVVGAGGANQHLIKQVVRPTLNPDRGGGQRRQLATRHDQEHEEEADSSSSYANAELPFREVRRKKKAPRPVQYGTAKVSFGGEGGEAAPYEVFIGNTHPASTEKIIEDVLKDCARQIEGEHALTEDLNILEVECLTKTREDGKPPHTKMWRVKVPNRFREHMKRPESFPQGWSNRRYFPARPKVPALHPGSGERSGTQGPVNAESQ